MVVATSIYLNFSFVLVIHKWQLFSNTASLPTTFVGPITYYLVTVPYFLLIALAKFP